MDNTENTNKDNIPSDKFIKNAIAEELDLDEDFDTGNEIEASEGKMNIEVDAGQKPLGWINSLPIKSRIFQETVYRKASMTDW